MHLPLTTIPLWGLPVWPTFGLGNLLVIQCILMMYAFYTKKDLKKTALVFAAMILGAAIGSQFLFSVMGGALGAIFMGLAMHRIIQCQFPASLLITVTLFSMIALGRIGCFLSGCCFGSPTHLPIGVVYGNHSLALFLHKTLGLVGPSAQFSVPVHPIQLYETLFLIVLIFLIFRFYRSFRNALTVPLFSMGMYYIFRG